MRKRIFLLDLDGTLFSGINPLPFAVDFIDYLNQNQFEFFAITNCPAKSSEEISQKLKNMNMIVAPSGIFTSGYTASKIISEELDIKSVYPVGTGALLSELEKNNIIITDKNPEAVVVGYDPQITYESLSKAINFIRNGSNFYATNIDPIIPSGHEVVPHTGSFVKLIEYATGKRCRDFGKPKMHFFDVVHSILPYPKEYFVMVGDRIDTDISFAKNAGIASYLVCENYEIKQDNLYKEIEPTARFKNLGELLNEKERYFYV